MSSYKNKYYSSTNSLTEISRTKLKDFLSSSSNNTVCDKSKCNTIKSSCSSSTSSSSSSSSSSKKHKHKSRKHKNRKSKCKSSTYTTSTSSSGSCSSACPSSSSNSCPSTSLSSCLSSSSSSCPTSSSSSCFTSCSSNTNSSSSCKTRKNRCVPYALKCNTYKDMCGNILIPGPQGTPSTSLANFTGINSEGYEPPGLRVIGDEIREPRVPTPQNIFFNSPNFNGVNIVATESILSSGDYDTFTFSMSGKYLFQYNVTVGEDVDIQFKLGTSTFGTQNISAAGGYGCTIIQDIIAGNSVTLTLSNNIGWSFASLTILKL